MQICSDPSLVRHRASLPHSEDNLMVQVPANLPTTMGTSVGLSPHSRLQTLAYPGPFKDSLPPTQPGKEVLSQPPPPEGSPLDHTRFQPRIQLLEKENARTSPSSLSSFLGSKERNSF